MLSGKLFGILLLKGTANISAMVRENSPAEMLTFLNDAAGGIRSAYVESEKARKNGQTMFEIEGEILPLVSIEQRYSAITALRATYRQAQKRASEIEGHWAVSQRIAYKKKSGFYLEARPAKDENDSQEDEVTGNSVTVTEKSADFEKVMSDAMKYRLALEKILSLSKSKEVKALINEALAA